VAEAAGTVVDYAAFGKRVMDSMKRQDLVIDNVMNWGEPVQMVQVALRGSIDLLPEEFANLKASI
jgi:hypothetical protein